MRRIGAVRVVARAFVQQRAALVQAFAAEALGVIKHHRHMSRSTYRQRLALIDVDQKIRCQLRVDGVRQSAQPALGLAGVGCAGVPVGGRGEMRVRRVVVAAAVHHRHLAVFVQPLKTRHAGVEAVHIVDLAQPVGADA